MPTSKMSFGTQGPGQTRVTTMVATAAAWGGNPDKDRTYSTHAANKRRPNVYKLNVNDVRRCVWSSVYNAAGIYEKKPRITIHTQYHSHKRAGGANRDPVRRLLTARLAELSAAS